MKAGTMLVPCILGIGALGVTAWKMGGSTVPVQKRDHKEILKNIDCAQPSKGEKQPKAVVQGDAEYQFDTMAAGQTGTHTFIIKNEGDAPLKLKKLGTSCKCTLGELGAEEVAPGDTVEVKLEWTPSEHQKFFRQRATLCANDPSLPRKEGVHYIELAVAGKISDYLQAIPGVPWELGDVPYSEEVTVFGSIVSPMEKEFEILEIKPDNPQYTFTHRPMTEEELTEARAKSGYRVTAKLNPKPPSEQDPENPEGMQKLGSFLDKVTVRTNLVKQPEVAFQISGRRQGPIEFRPLPGSRWHRGPVLLGLGRISAGEGKTAQLLMDIKDYGDVDFKIEGIESSEEYVKVTQEIEKSLINDDLKTYRLTFTVPNDRPAVAHSFSEPVLVTIKTNHPHEILRNIVIKVSFVSF